MEFFSYFWGGIKNARPILSDVLWTGILGALVHPVFPKVSTLGGFLSTELFYPVHTSLKNHQDVTHFDYICLDKI